MKLNKMIILMTSLFLIFGCQTETETTFADPFVGGQESLRMAFIPEEPPAETYDSGQSSFAVTMELENVGEYFISKENLQFRLRGLDASAMGKTSDDFTKTSTVDLLETKKDSEGNIIPGTFTTFSFSDLSYQEDLLGNTPLPIIVDACYDYGTDVLSELCIKENNLNTDVSVCSGRGDKPVKNSGSPLQIINLKQTPVSEDTTSFTFTIQHSGTGSIFEKGTTCDSDNLNSINQVYVSVDTGIAGTLLCNGLTETTAGLVKLQEGKRSVRCTQTIDNLADFIRPININLEFAYEKTLNTQIIIKSTE